MTSMKSKTTNQMPQMPQMVLVDAGKLSQGLKTTFNGVAMVFDALGVYAEVENSIVSTRGNSKKKSQEVNDSGTGKTSAKANDNTASDGFDVPAVESTDKLTGGNITVVSEESKTEDTSESNVVEKTEEEAPTVDATNTVNGSDATDGNTPADVNEPDAVTSGIEYDDITKIIVQKIKKDRSNNEKIGQILKTYGVVKASDLDPSKYEAFLTDVAAL